MLPDAASAAAIAAHRFGLGEADLALVGGDARGWLLAQIGPAEPQPGTGLASGAEALLAQATLLRAQLQARRPAAANPMANMMAGSPEAAPADTPPMADRPAQADALRRIALADAVARQAAAIGSRQPFNERLALFWANHFTVSQAKASARGLAGAFEREAIRPHIGGRFVDLLRAAVQHGAMLRYLDNDRSAGPQSVVVQRAQRRAGRLGQSPRLTGLNENLARELLELHTLGAAGGGAAYGGWGGYTQADVTALAAVLTGWRVPPPEQLAQPGAPSMAFDPDWHQPGEKWLLGRRWPEGPEALDAVLAHLAGHPSTARFVCHKLARHLVADVPPPALVARMAARWQASGGDLPAVLATLIDAPEAWLPAPAKLRSPEEFVIATARLLPPAQHGWRLADGSAGRLGMRPQAAPSPAGWPDDEAGWLGPEAVWKRVEWAIRVADRVGPRSDARALAAAALGPRLAPETAREIARAADSRQALALLLMAPEFQRR